MIFAGASTLLYKEVLRFWKVGFQTVAAPVLTAVLYLLIFGHVLAGHADVNAIDLAGAGLIDWVDLQVMAADTLKRVLGPVEEFPMPSLERIVALTEIKTVWHTKSLA